MSCPIKGQVPSTDLADIRPEGSPIKSESCSEVYMVNALMFLGFALIVGSFFLNAQQEPQRRVVRIEDIERKRRR
jgi:hypothetical protein